MPLKLPTDWKLALSPLAEATLGRTLVEQFVEISELTDERLVLVSTYGEFVFDRTQAVVLQNGAPLCDFQQVQNVDIFSLPGRQDTKSWAVSLYLSFTKRITLGRTYDDGEASVIAAKVAGVVGRKVVALTTLRR